MKTTSSLDIHMEAPHTVKVNVYGPALEISIRDEAGVSLIATSIFPPSPNHTDAENEQAITSLLATLIDQMEHCLIEHMRLCEGCHEPRDECVCDMLSEEEWAWNRRLARAIIAKGLV